MLTQSQIESKIARELTNNPTALKEWNSILKPNKRRHSFITNVILNQWDCGDINAAAFLVTSFVNCVKAPAHSSYKKLIQKLHIDEQKMRNRIADDIRAGVLSGIRSILLLDVAGVLYYILLNDFNRCSPNKLIKALDVLVGDGWVIDDSNHKTIELFETWYIKSAASIVREYSIMINNVNSCRPNIMTSLQQFVPNDNFCPEEEAESIFMDKAVYNVRNMSFGIYTKLQETSPLLVGCGWFLSFSKKNYCHKSKMGAYLLGQLIQIGAPFRPENGRTNIKTKNAVCSNIDKLEQLYLRNNKFDVSLMESHETDNYIKDKYLDYLEPDDIKYGIDESGFYIRKKPESDNADDDSCEDENNDDEPQMEHVEWLENTVNEYYRGSAIFYHRADTFISRLSGVGFCGTGLYTDTHIRNKLVDKGVTEDIADNIVLIAAVLRRVREMGYISDYSTYALDVDAPQTPITDDIISGIKRDADKKENALRQQISSLESRVKALESELKEKRHQLNIAEKQTNELKEEIDDYNELVKSYEEVISEYENVSDETSAANAEDEEASVFPYDTDLNIVVYGGFDNFRAGLERLIPSIRTIPPASSIDTTPMKKADIVFIQPNRMSHSMYWNVRDTAKCLGKKYYHLRYGGPQQCATFIIKQINLYQSIRDGDVNYSH